MPRSKRVINPDGKGPRVWCRRCNAHVWAEQRPWPKSGYVAKRHEHTEQESGT
jgi:hypothetical protein